MFFSYRFLVISLLVIAALHIVFSIFYLYWTMRWIDIPMHFLAGLWVGAAAGSYLLHAAPDFARQKQYILLHILFITGAAFFVGVFWEFFEFFLSEYIVKDTRIVDVGNLYTDTLFDLAMDFFGSTIVVFLFALKARKG